MAQASSGPKEQNETNVGLGMTPAVIIGLGGTGVQCVRRAKVLLGERLKDRVPILQYVLIDSDGDSFVNRPNLASVDRSEQCNIGGRALIPIINDPEAHAWLLGQIPSQLRIEHLRIAAQGRGCAQNRGAGRVALLANFNTVKDAIRGAITSVQALRDQLKTKLGGAADGLTVSGGVTVYIVSSVAGGTGSGAFLDVALICRKLLDPGDPIVGVFVLPGSFETAVAKIERAQEDRIKANTYAALQELQALQDANWPTALEIQISKNEVINLARDERLFSLCYLLDDRNMDGKRFTSPEEVYDLVARFLLHENGTAVGNAAATNEANIGALASIATCPKTGLPLAFSSFAASSLRYPADELLRYCAKSTAELVLNDRLLGRGMDSASSAALMDQVLQTARLDDRGASDQILDTLMLNQSRQTMMVDDLPSSFKAKANAADFGQALRDSLDSFTSNQLPRYRAAMERNRQTYDGADDEGAAVVRKLIDGSIGDWMEKSGALGAESVASCLLAAVQGMRGELLGENKAWVDHDRRALEGERNDTLEKLLQMSALSRALSKRDERLRAQAIRAQNLITAGDLGRTAREVAIAILRDVETHVSRRRSALSGFVADLGALRNEYLMALEQVRSAQGRESGGLVLEQDVTPAGYFRAYFDQAISERNEATTKALGLSLDTALLETSRAEIADRLETAAAGLFEAAVMSTSVVEFVAKRAGQDAALRARLQAMYDMCVPFWRVAIPEAGFEFSEVVLLGCNPSGRDAQGKPIFPRIVSDWARGLAGADLRGANRDIKTVPITLPYEIELVRYAHGARAFYLTDVADWERRYERQVKAGSYALHLHRSFADLESLIPDDRRVNRRTFALGLALGLIAKRGDHYYVNVQVEGSPNSPTGWSVPYHTESLTVFGAADVRSIPNDTGTISFKFRKAKPPDSLYLTQGRVASRDAFVKALDRAAVVLKVVSEYVGAVGTVEAKRQLAVYAEALEEMDQPSQLRKQIHEEVEAVRAYIMSLE